MQPQRQYATPIGRFMHGISYLITGFNLMMRPGLRRFMLLPLLMSCIFFAGLWWMFSHYASELMDWVNAGLPGWMHWLDWVIYPLLYVIVLLVSAYLFSLVANLIAAPFNGTLSIRVIQHLTGKKPVLESCLKPTVLIAMLGRQLQLIFYYVLRVLGFLILFLFPVIHVFVGFAWLIFNAWMMALQYADYPMDLHGVSFRDMRAQLASNRSLSIGFGAAVLFVTVIPVLNFFVMPAAVAGASCMFVECYAEQYEEDSN